MTANNRYKSDYSSYPLNAGLSAELSGTVHYDIKFEFNAHDKTNEAQSEIAEKTLIRQTDAEADYHRGNAFLEQGDLNAAIES